MTDYYVSQVDGSDSYNGQYETFEGGSDGPWLTVAKVNSSQATFSGGDSISFKTDGRWDSSTALFITQDGASNNHITYKSYGSGMKPILTCAGEFSGWQTPGNWTDNTGDVWYITHSFELYRMTLDGTEYAEAPNAASVDSTNRWAYISGESRLYVYATENPATFYDSILIRKTTRSVDVDASYITLRGLDARFGQYSVWLQEGNSYIYIRDCDLGRISQKAIYAEGVTYCQVFDNDCNMEIPSGWSSRTDLDSLAPVHDVIQFVDHASYACEDNKIYNNIVIDGGHNGIGLVGDDASMGVNNNEVYGNTVYCINSPDMRPFQTQGSASGLCTGNKIYQNTFFNFTVPAQFNGNANECYYNVFYGPFESAAEPGGGEAVQMHTDSNTVCSANKLYNNTFYDCESHCVQIQIQSGGGINGSHEISNNIFMNWGSGSYGIHIQDHANIDSNTYKNNQFYKSGDTDCVYYGPDAVDDYPHTVAEFNAENGTNGDTISGNQAGDPSMTDPANQDFTLQIGSPCIDAAVDVSLTRDYAGRGVGAKGGIDIGANEYWEITGREGIRLTIG